MDKGWIWLDMDGTIADLYSVNGWLDDLNAFNTRPYRNAGMIYDLLKIMPVLVELKMSGYKIGIISWCSKAHNADYDKAVIEAKMEWLKKYLFDAVLDKVLITAYGMRKADTCRKYGKGILVDDEERNRKEWDLGTTIDANKNIIAELRELLA